MSTKILSQWQPKSFNSYFHWEQTLLEQCQQTLKLSFTTIRSKLSSNERVLTSYIKIVITCILPVCSAYDWTWFTWDEANQSYCYISLALTIWFCLTSDWDSYTIKSNLSWSHSVVLYTISTKSYSKTNLL